MARALAVTLAASGIVLAAPSDPAWAAPGTIRASLPSSVVDPAGGNQANGPSDTPVLSTDGTVVAFTSQATNLVPDDSNGAGDVYVRTGTVTQRVSSVNGSNVQGNALSHEPAISTTGRFVVFSSIANNLVSGDTNSLQDVFLRDRSTSLTERISVTNGGGQVLNGPSSNPSVSSDGRIVAFDSTASDLVTGDSAIRDVYVRDRAAQTTVRISVGPSGPGNADSFDPSVSPDGRYVAFSSTATNLLAEADTNGVTDVFLFDRQNSTLRRVSMSSAGVAGNLQSEDPVVSQDGRFVAFRSGATNLVANDSNGRDDIFVRDVPSNTTERVSVTDAEAQASGGTIGSRSPSISPDGRYVAFESDAVNLLSTADSNALLDVFLRDRTAGTTVRASISNSGGELNGDSTRPSVSGDGRFVAFASTATNAVNGDTNAHRDIFVRELAGTSGGGGGPDSDSDGLLDNGRDANGDGDFDDVGDSRPDNCTTVYNPDQRNSDGDEAGDACDADNDGDHISDVEDNCRSHPNTDQADADGDGVGDACDGTFNSPPPGPFPTPSPSPSQSQSPTPSPSPTIQPPPDVDVSTSLTARYHRGDRGFEGRVSAGGTADCERGRAIKVKRITRNGRRVVARAGTNGAGEWFAKARPRKGRYVVIAATKIFVNPAGARVTCRRAVARVRMR